VDNADVIEVYNGSVNFVTGYVNTDLNGDNIADITDMLIAYNNATTLLQESKNTF
jgi:hypothetical protein